MTASGAHHLCCRRVFFMNHNLAMDRSIANHPDVITRHKLEQYLGRHSRLSPRADIRPIDDRVVL